MWQVPGAGASTYTNKLNGMKPAKLEHWRSFIFRGETWRQFPRPQLWNNLQRFRSMKLQRSVSPPVFCPWCFWEASNSVFALGIFGTFLECSFDKEKKWASFDAPPTTSALFCAGRLRRDGWTLRHAQLCFPFQVWLAGRPTRGANKPTNCFNVVMSSLGQRKVIATDPHLEYSGIPQSRYKK